MQKFVAVTYPGVVKNAENALQTLGGLQKVSNDFYHGRNLELSHMPDNPYIRPTYSQKKEETVLTLVVRARRRKRKPKNPPSSEVVEVDNSPGMVDAETSSLLVQSGSGNEDLLPRLIPPDIPTVLSWFDSSPGQNFEEDGPLILPPFAFSRFLFANPYIMCKETEHKELNIKQQKARKDVIGLSVRPERKALSVCVGGQDEFPSAPSEEVVREVDTRIKKKVPHESVQRLLDERPMWTRNAIIQRCAIEENMSKSLLPKYAFYITCGPWGRLWCKFGYDPRKDPQAAKYQTIMCQFKNHEKIAERNRLRLGSMGTFLTGRDAPKKLENPESTWQYRSGQLPGFRQMWYSVCDIHLGAVEGMIKAQMANVFTRLELKGEPSTASSTMDTAEKVVDTVREGRMADPDVGWLSRKILDAIRDAIREDVGQMVSEMNKVEEEQSLAQFRVDEWREEPGLDKEEKARESEH